MGLFHYFGGHMVPRIKIAESVSSKRLRYPFLGERTFSVFLDYLFGSVIILASLLVFISEVRSDYGQSGFFAVVSAMVAVYMIGGFYYMNRLLEIEGRDMEQNRAKIIAVLQTRYPKYTIYPGDKVIRAVRGRKYFTFDRELIFVLNEGEIYMNSSTTGRGDAKYMFLAIPNYLFCKKFADSFYSMK